MTGKHGSLRERFWRHVSAADRRRPVGCWAWTGARNIDGYGYLRGRERTEKAHRVSWELANGPIPEGGHILHSCDHPWCVNPAHLRVGTMKENIREASSRGRLGKARGEKHYRARLNDDVVKHIRFLRDIDVPTVTIAAIYGVAPVTVWRVVNRMSWKHVA